MAVREIALMGNPVLLRPAQPVLDPAAPEIAELIHDMIETMAAADGIGLAAPQISVPLRVIIFRVPHESATPETEEDDHPAQAGAPLILINPEITPLNDEKIDDWEACLSVPGLCGQVSRFRYIRYQGLTPDGQLVAREADDFHARVVQHECDHLDGILYPQRMTDLSTLMFTSQAAHYGEQVEPA